MGVSCEEQFLPPFVTERWRQKCPQGTSVGIGRRFSLSGHKRLRCFARPLRALEPPSDLIPPPVQCGICGALRATMIYYDLTSSILSFSRPRPARSHCENSGKSDDSSANARSDRALRATLNSLLEKLFRIFDCSSDTPARQIANKFAFTLAYSYL